MAASDPYSFLNKNHKSLQCVLLILFSCVKLIVEGCSIVLENSPVVIIFDAN